MELTSELMARPDGKVVKLSVPLLEVLEMEELRISDVLVVLSGDAVGDTMAEVTAGAKSNALFAARQQLPLPSASQQNPPSGNWEFLHWTTNLLAPRPLCQQALIQV